MSLIQRGTWKQILEMSRQANNKRERKKAIGYQKGSMWPKILETTSKFVDENSRKKILWLMMIRMLPKGKQQKYLDRLEE